MRVIILPVMTTIIILPEKANSYRAVAGGKESKGRTAGEALDAIAAQFVGEEGGTLLVILNPKSKRRENQT